MTKTSANRALWQRAMHGVEPLTPCAATPPMVPKPAQIRVAAPAAISAGTIFPPLALDRFAGIDRANAERLKRGKHAIEARLDLHGMTQDEAHRALTAFIRGARAAGKRCVLIITGRGNGKGFGGGVLKSAVPRWLDEPALRPYLLAIATAQPRDGGSGALYVMLRRTRDG